MSSSRTTALKLPAYLLVGLLLLAALWYGVNHQRAQPTEKLPTTIDEFRQIPGGAVTVQAGEFLLTLANEGKLPGFNQGEHGTMHAGIVDGNANTPSGSEQYPVSRVIHFSKRGNDSEYFYAVVLESNGGPWKLQRAWRTDPQGQLIENYPTR